MFETQSVDLDMITEYCRYEIIGMETWKYLFL